MNRFWKRFFRFFFSCLGGSLGTGLFSVFKEIIFNNITQKPIMVYGCYVISFIVFFTIVYLIYPIVLKGLESIINRVDNDIRKLSLADFALGTVGLFVGLFISIMVGFVSSKIGGAIFGSIITVLLYIIIISTSVTIFIRRRDDLKRVIDRFRKTSLKPGSTSTDNKLVAPKYVDTSVIIDGRIKDIIATGFIEGDIIIPSFVLFELQYIADSFDDEKRVRGRHGLDVLNSLKEDLKDRVHVVDIDLPDKAQVDSFLLDVAKENGGVVITNDFNLNKVAGVKGIKVLNINDLANAVKPVVLPGERLNVKVSQKGKERAQGVGYLNDGTMVIVEDADSLIGEEIQVEALSVLQTSAGRLIFAKVKDDR